MESPRTIDNHNAACKGPSMLCISTFGERGQAFITEVQSLGIAVSLLTSTALEEAAVSTCSPAKVYAIDPPYTPSSVRKAALAIARHTVFSSVVALHERDAESASLIREEFRLPGAGQSGMRFFRDKLAMRCCAFRTGIRVPAFSALHNDDEILKWTEINSPPWLLKPRFGSGSIGIQKIEFCADLWAVLETLNSRRTDYVLEQFVNGRVFHVDSLKWKGAVTFQCASEYGIPPMQVVHSGGIFSSKTLAPTSELALRLSELNREVLEMLGMENGVAHCEYLEATDGTLHFLEASSRVAGGQLPLLIESASGVNLWREWAKIESALLLGLEYRPGAETNQRVAALISSYTRGPISFIDRYDAPEIVSRIVTAHQVGLVVADAEYSTVSELAAIYVERLGRDLADIRNGF